MYDSSFVYQLSKKIESEHNATYNEKWNKKAKKQLPRLFNKIDKKIMQAAFKGSYFACIKTHSLFEENDKIFNYRDEISKRYEELGYKVEYNYVPFKVIRHNEIIINWYKLG